MNHIPRGALAMALLTLALSADVSAHAVLVKAAPGQDAVLDASPASVSLWFNEALEVAFSSLIVRDGAGQVVAQGKAEGLPDNGLALPLAAPLAPGNYGVHYRVLSVDGHIVEGESHFAIEASGKR